MERFVENPDFLQELFLEEAWKNVDKIDGFIESKANAEEFEVTADEVNSLYRTMHSIKGSCGDDGAILPFPKQRTRRRIYFPTCERNPRLRRRICSRFCSFCVWFPAF